MTLKTGRSLGFAAALLLGSFACSAQNDVGIDDGLGKDDTTGTDFVEAYALSGDATLGQLAVATGSAAGPVTLLDAHDGAPLRVLKPTSPTSVNVSVRQASGIVAIGSSGIAWIFKADGTQLHAIPGASAGALSLDGKVLAGGGSGAGGGGGVRRFDVASGAELSPPLELPPPGDAGVEILGSVAISPDGALVAASGTNGVYLWSTIDGAQVAQVEAGHSLALSTTELAVGSEKAVTVYSLTGTMLSQYQVNGGQTFLAYSPDGTKLAYTTRLPGAYTGPTLAKIVDRPSGVEVANLFEDRQGVKEPNGKWVIPRGLAFIDGAVAFAWSDRRVTLFSAADGVPIWSRILDE